MTDVSPPAQPRGDSPLDLPEDDPFGPYNLPYGVCTTAGRPERPHIVVRYGDHVLDAGGAAAAFGSEHTELLQQPLLGPLMAAGRPVWQAVRAELREWLTAPEHRGTTAGFLRPLSEATMRLPFEVADYVDFYASEHHATTTGQILRPENPELPPNWKHLPIGYHGRAGTVVVSGTPVVRPRGQRKPPQEDAPVFGPSQRLDIEAEVGFVVGTPSAHGESVPLAAFRDHVFGVALLNDWSARDLQGWEQRPLGPFLGKSFATSLAAWITPLDALDAARVPPPPRDRALLEYLDDAAEPEPGGIDLRITVAVNGHTVSEPPFSAMYWTAAQQLAHMTVNGASLRTGDLFASGTVSGPELSQRGCLLELTWGGKNPLELPDGKRTFLEDGDEIVLSAWAPGASGTRIGMGEVRGVVRPAR
ncbi:fumarylacetoacetate hydrolase [Streptomyces sp. Amel2xB2]|uniref:fumarylacetoacetase n=1 Tax=Streptomyces sp. Amel2xB2 TaxID=1305829 RepID=UPI000DC0103A|nr:fumarylacetoacetase [Streptomyces sp. Amel2xB2]RAJ57271.1 fumarylacetoacetate hydrolase [Streptomyces sp. Amel2xB2]